jgi:hypothetical protein
MFCLATDPKAMGPTKQLWTEISKTVSQNEFVAGILLQLWQAALHRV